MTARARKVLEDCKEALADLDGGMQYPNWRRRWVAMVALLRTVGYVLKAVDRESSPEMRKAIDAEWNQLKGRKPLPEIYWGFIEEERNNIIHEYRFSGQHAWASCGGSITIREDTSGKLFTATAPPGSVDGVSLHLFTHGPFAGYEQKDVAKQAIEWWEGYLDRIDLAAAGGLVGK